MGIETSVDWPSWIFETFARDIYLKYIFFEVEMLLFEWLVDPRKDWLCIRTRNTILHGWEKFSLDFEYCNESARRSLGVLLKFQKT